MILRAQVGSGAHGTSVSGQDDRDEMGICLEPPEFVTGLARVPAGTGATTGTVAFEQYERHTAWDRPGGVKNRSGAGDLDVTIYSARKWCRLALDGNPTVLLLLFAPASERMVCTGTARELLANADRFISLRSRDRFLGYLHSQRQGMQEIGHTNRPELVAQYGYDTKFAMHAVRLGMQGVELMDTGRITLPIQEPHLSTLRAVRSGQRSLVEVLAMVGDLEDALRNHTSSSIPAEPDVDWVNGWLHRAHLRYWEEGWL